MSRSMREFRYIYDAINHHENEPYPTALRRNFDVRTHFWSVFTDSFGARD